MSGNLVKLELINPEKGGTVGAWINVDHIIAIVPDQEGVERVSSISISTINEGIRTPGTATSSRTATSTPTNAPEGTASWTRCVPT